MGAEVRFEGVMLFGHGKVLSWLAMDHLRSVSKLP